jgi:L-ribulokinase
MSLMAFALRAASSVTALTRRLESYRAGQTGLLRMTWDNGDRTVLVNPNLGGVTRGWNLVHTAQDELFAAIEGTALHTRIILERMQEQGSPVNRIINGGRIPQKNRVFNQIYANALNQPVLVPSGDVTSLGSVIFAFLASGDYPSVEQAQAALCSPCETFLPGQRAAAPYGKLYPLYREIYFSL